MYRLIQMNIYSMCVCVCSELCNQIPKMNYLIILSPQPTPVLPVHTWLYSHTQLHVIVKFADDTTVIGLITDNDETAYREEGSTLTKWCQENHLSLIIDKTKELVVDFRRQSREHTHTHTSPSTRHLHCGELPDRLVLQIKWGKLPPKLPSTLLEVSFPPSRTSTPGGV